MGWTCEALSAQGVGSRKQGGKKREGAESRKQKAEREAEGGGRKQGRE